MVPLKVVMLNHYCCVKLATELFTLVHIIRKIGSQMPSKYRPQLFGWSTDLSKGSRHMFIDKRLIYANERYCVFIRRSLGNKLFYLALSTICFFLSFFILIYMGEFIVELAIGTYGEPEPLPMITLIGAEIAIVIAIYAAVLAEFYQNLLPARGMPIIFNRKTNKVYVNESYFFNFKFWRNPLMFLFPFKRRIKEYDWQDLHGVAVTNYSRNVMIYTVLMVCKPGTDEVIDHILLERDGYGIGLNFELWGWACSFMGNDKVAYNDRAADIEDGKYGSAQEDEFKQYYIKNQHWPEWMLAAFNANSPEHLAQIKQQYGVQ